MSTFTLVVMVHHSVLLQFFSELLSGFVQKIILPHADPVQSIAVLFLFSKAVVEVRENGTLCLIIHSKGCRKEPYIVKVIREKSRGKERVRTTHGQPGNSPRRLFSLDAVIFLDKTHHIYKRFFHLSRSYVRRSKRYII